MSDEVDLFYNTIAGGTDGEGGRFWDFFHRDQRTQKSHLWKYLQLDKGDVLYEEAARTDPDVVACMVCYTKIKLLANLANGLLLYPSGFDETINIPASTGDGVITLSKGKEQHGDLSAQLNQAARSFAPIHERANMWPADYLKSSIGEFLKGYARLPGYSTESMEKSAAEVQGNLEAMTSQLDEHEETVRKMRDGLLGAEELDRYQTRVLLVTNYLDKTIYPQLRQLCGQLQDKVHFMREQPFPKPRVLQLEAPPPATRPTLHVVGSTPKNEPAQQDVGFVEYETFSDETAPGGIPQSRKHAAEADATPAPDAPRRRAYLPPVDRGSGTVRHVDFAAMHRKRANKDAGLDENHTR